MESMGNILKNMNQQPSETKESSLPTSGSMDRRAVIQRQLVSFYLSCRREQPEAAMLDIETDLAMQDWEEIPTDQIQEVAKEARKVAGEFMPSNGLMAKIWRGVQGDQFEEAQKAIRMKNNAKYLIGGTEAPTEKERGDMAAQAATLAEMLKK